MPYIKEAATIFTFYTAGVLVFAYLAAFHISETKYFTEDDVTIPKHVLEERGMSVSGQEAGSEAGEKEEGVEVQDMPMKEKA